MTDIRIKIKDLKEKVREFTVKSTDTIKIVKEKAGDVGYKWTFNGENLKEDKTIEYYGFDDDDIILKGERVIGGKTQ